LNGKAEELKLQRQNGKSLLIMGKTEKTFFKKKTEGNKTGSGEFQQDE